MIYNAPSINPSEVSEESVIQVDVLMASDWQNIADDVMAQIAALCGGDDFHKWTVNGKFIDKITTQGNLASAAGFYRTGTRFHYHSSTVTKIKTTAKTADPENSLAKSAPWNTKKVTTVTK